MEYEFYFWPYLGRKVTFWSVWRLEYHILLFPPLIVNATGPGWSSACETIPQEGWFTWRYAKATRGIIVSSRDKVCICVRTHARGGCLQIFTAKFVYISEFTFENVTFPVLFLLLMLTETFSLLALRPWAFLRNLLHCNLHCRSKLKGMTFSFPYPYSSQLACSVLLLENFHNWPLSFWVSF